MSSSSTSIPLLPTASVIRTALGRLSERLGKAGVKVGHSEPLLPNLANSARLYMRLLLAVIAASWPLEFYRRTQTTAEGLAADDKSLTAERSRGAVLSHREWLAADVARSRLQAQWREVFRQWDVVLCPVMPTPAYPHDHSSPDYARASISTARTIPISTSWYGRSWQRPRGCPRPWRRSSVSETGLPIGVQIIGPYWRTAPRWLSPS